MEEDDILSWAEGLKVPEPKKNDKDRIAGIVDEELASLGYPGTARLSILGDIGRENNWDRGTIFKGHKDPKNQAFNQGLFSYQGDRQTELQNFIKQNGGTFDPSDDNVRLMTRYIDHDLKTKFPKIREKILNASNTYDASEALRQAIKYVPTAPYNTFDPEFRVRNNSIWAKRAKSLGLGQDVDEAGIWGDVDALLGQSDVEDTWKEVDEVLGKPGPTVLGQQFLKGPDEVPDTSELEKIGQAAAEGRRFDQKPLLDPATLATPPVQTPPVPPPQPVLAKADPSKLFKGNVKVAPKAKKRHYVADDGVISDIPEKPKERQALGIVDVDPKWSDEEKVRYAANKVIIGRETPTGPVTPEDIEKWIEASKATGDPDALVKGNRKSNQFAIFPDMLDQIFEAKRKSPEQLEAEAKERAIAPPSDDELRQRAIKELTQSGQTANLNRFDRDSPEYKRFDPSTDISEDAIQQKIAEYKEQELNTEAKSRAYDVAQKNEGVGGAGLSGVYGGVGSAIHTLAGTLRPFSSFIPGYETLRDTGKEMQSVSQYRNKGKGAKDTSEAVAQFVGETVPQLAEMVALPGGAVGKFAFLGAAKSAGAGDPLPKIAQAATEGTLSGALFKGAEKLEKPLARLGTVFGGSMTVNAAMGIPLDENIKKTLLNTAFEAQNVYGAKALDKVYRFWKGGDPYDIQVTPKGAVELLKTNPEREITGGEVVTDPKNGAYPDPIRGIHERIVKPVADASTDDLKKKVTPAKTVALEPAAKTGKPSKVGKSIEAKTIEDDLSKGFEGTAEYDPITFKEQGKKVADLINTDLEKAKAIMNGNERLPDDLRGSALITGLEKYARENKDVELLRDLAKSPLVAETSRHAQELGLLRERAPYSPVKLIQEVETARGKISRPKAVRAVVQEIKATIRTPKPKDWAEFVESIKCK